MGRPLHSAGDELEQAIAKPAAPAADAAPPTIAAHDAPPATSPETDNEIADYDHTLVDVTLVDPNPYQPRKMFDDDSLVELSDSLQQHGMLQPLVVRKAGERYELISGDRRLRAAIKAGWTQVPIHVRMVEDRQMAEMAIVENLQRKDLGPLEKAASFKKYLDQYPTVLHNVS